MYLNKHLKLYVLNIITDKISVDNICTDTLTIVAFQKSHACAKLRVGLPTQDGRTRYLSLNLSTSSGEKCPRERTSINLDR